MVALDGKLIFGGGKVLRVALVVAILGWLGLGIGFWQDRVGAYFAYLTAFAFVASIALGALIFLMTAYVVNARWNVAIRRLNESIVSVFPLLALLFVPIAFGLNELYLWAAPPADLPAHELHLLHHKQAYLNQPFFLLRSGAYFILWIVSAFLLCRWSLRRDTSGIAPAPVPGDEHARERVFSSALLPLVSLALTFAAFDWLMSLQPFWISTIFGVYYFAGGFVASFGLLSLLAYAAQRSLAPEVIRPAHFHALGRLMFGFTIFWAYIAFFQALLIALPDRPEETGFYLRRLAGGWDVSTALLGIARFVVPFFLLLPRRIKFDGRAMAALGAWIIAGHYLDMYWLVMPIYDAHGPLPNLWDVSALCAVAGLSTAFAAWRLQGRAIIPVADPFLPQSIQYRSPT
jgi:hypothetical protein